MTPGETLDTYTGYNIRSAVYYADTWLYDTHVHAVRKLRVAECLCREFRARDRGTRRRTLASLAAGGSLVGEPPGDAGFRKRWYRNVRV